MDLKIKKAILHILDSNATLPVFSQSELETDDDTINVFLSTHIRKTYEDMSIKKGKFKDDSAILSLTSKMDSDFQFCSIKIAEELFLLMKTHPDIPSADLLTALVVIDNNCFFCIIKFNYRNGYTHFIEHNSSGVINKIIVHKAIFSSENQKVEEAAMININTLESLIIEKPYIIDGEKKNYFSNMFLQINTDLSKKDSIKAVNQVASEIAHKYYNDDFSKQAAVRAAIYRNLENESIVRVYDIAESAFGDDETIKNEYIASVKQTGVKDVIPFEKENSEKAFNKYKIKTDNGIELNIPMNLYKNKNAIEFMNNPDGTFSIVIKQVNKIINK